MRILIIEDDQNKITQISNFFERKNITELVKRLSYQSGLKEILKEDYDLIILDMSMPTFDISPKDPVGGRPKQFAGKEILRQMYRYGKKMPVIILTQFGKFGEGRDELTLEELGQQLKDLYSDIFLGAIYYSPDSEWEEILEEKIKKYFQGDI